MLYKGERFRVETTPGGWKDRIALKDMANRAAAHGSADPATIGGIEKSDSHIL
jgi:hypothetical protein